MYPSEALVFTGSNAERLQEADSLLKKTHKYYKDLL